MILVPTTADDRTAGQTAAMKRFEANLDTIDRPGWTGGKCPKNEYFGILGEIGAAIYLGYPVEDLVLYSDNSADYKAPDMGPIEVKCGKSFTDWDVNKGAKVILWVRPVEATSVYYCNIPSCTTKIHNHLTGDVQIRGWNFVTDEFTGMGVRHYVKKMRDPSGLLGLSWPKLVAA